MKRRLDPELAQLLPKLPLGDPRTGRTAPGAGLSSEANAGADIGLFSRGWLGRR